MPPQNMLLWYKDHFELKALEKIASVRGIFRPLFYFSSRKQKVTVLCERYPPYYTRMKEILLSPETGSRGQENSIQKDLIKNKSYFLLVFPYILVTFLQLPSFVQTNMKTFRFCHFLKFYFLVNIPIVTKINI